MKRKQSKKIKTKIAFSTYLKTIFSLDLRSLALFRICAGFIILFDLSMRSTDVIAHYSDYGVLPRAAAAMESSPYVLSIHMISGLWQIQALLFLTAAIFAVMLIFGYKTRLASFISWLLFFSLENRNVWVISGSDQLFRLLLFWSIFLPLGARYSIDSFRYSIKKLPNTVFSAATIGYILQINYIYFFTVIFKFNPMWVRDGTAVFYALQNSAFITPFGSFMNKYFSWSFYYLTFITYALEAVGYYFMYSPFRNGLIRTITVFTFIGMHIGFGLGLDIGIFSFAVSAAFIALLPSYFWEKLKEILRFEKRPRATLYMDTSCHFCKFSVLFIQTFLLIDNLRLVSRKHKKSTKKQLFSETIWISIGLRGKKYHGLNTVVPISKLSPLLYPFSFIIPAKLLHTLEKSFFRTLYVIHEHKLFFWKISKDSVSPTFTLSKISTIFITTCLLIITYFNLNSLSGKWFPAPAFFSHIAYLGGLQQKWNMFAPHPPTANTWYVIPGNLKNKKQVDLYYFGQPVNWNLPSTLGRKYENARWGKYFSNMSMLNKSDPKYYMMYLCNKWNSEHKNNAEKLVDMDMYFMKQKISLNGTKEKTEKFHVYKWYCILPKPVKNIK